MKIRRALCVIAVLAVGVSVPSTAFAWTKPVRVSQGPRGNPCNWFHGSVTLNQAQTRLSISGTLHGCRGGQASVWLQWYEINPFVCIMFGEGCHNAKDGQVRAGRTVAVSKSHAIPLVRPSNITVTVCSNYRGWNCGGSAYL
jgi:hypothetical protein